jgi:hydrogenase maturation protein HypF
MLLEAAACLATGDQAYTMELELQTIPWQVDTRPMMRQIAADVEAKRGIPEIARRFHLALARTIDGVCRKIREADGVETVCLSGGTFQNWTLLTHAVALLRRSGFQVFLHSQVPANDGGLSLGQAVIGAAFLER